MKRYRFTILFAVILAGLGAYLYFVELPAERTQVLSETQGKKIVPFEMGEITGLSVRSDTTKVVLAPGENRTWKITAPLQTNADSREVDSLLRALLLGKVSRVVEEKATALAPFGLEHPSVVLTVSAGSRRETLSLGDAGPISSTLYAMRASDQKVLLTDLAPTAFLNKTLLTFRDKQVLPFDQTKAERLRLMYPKIQIVLYQTTENDKKKWKIRAPQEADADQTAVRTLLFKLEDLKALGFIDPGPKHAALTKKLTKPKAKITVHVDGADRTVKLFQLKPASGEAYAVTTAEAPIYRINPTVIKDLTKEVFALRDKRLLGIDLADLAKLAVKTRGEQYVLINQNNEWGLEDHPEEKLKQEAVDLFVSRVVNLPAEFRATKREGPLAPYGLTHPAAEFTATAKDGKRHGRLALGTRVGGLVYATGQGLRGIYQARADLLTQIPAKSELLAKAGQATSPAP
ncbi:MAG TPA: DUF4340 domain-containing protein [Nitrospiraceae bacterium]|nr:DUF4340 domain-containing protein [Nitrospiraceae bacterium]